MSHPDSMHYLATEKMICVFQTAAHKPDSTSFENMLDDELLLPGVGHNPLPDECKARCVSTKCERVFCECKQKGVLCTTFRDRSLREESLCENISFPQLEF